jgi:hypothetical protein
MCGHGQLDRGRIELARRRRTPDSPAVLQAGVPGDRRRFRGGTPWIDGPDCFAEGPHIALIRALAGKAGPFPRPRPLVLVAETLLLGPLERRQFDQEALTFIPLARAAEANHHRRERRVLPAPATERRIARREVHQVVEIRAGQA